MVAAPLVAGDEVFGAIGAFSNRGPRFERRRNVALVRALADHAAAAMANARLIEAARPFAGGAGRSAPTSSARCARSPPGSARPPTCRPCSSARSTRRPACSTPTAPGSTSSTPRSSQLRRRLRLGRRSARRRRTGRTTRTRRSTRASPARPSSAPGAVWTGDYVDRRARSRTASSATTRTSRRTGIGIRSWPRRSIGEAGPFGALTVFTSRTDAWAETDAALLVADRRPGGHHHHHDAAHRGARASRARRSAAAPRPSRRCARSPPGSRCCATRRRSSATSSSRRAAWSAADGVILDLLDPATGNLHWALDDGVGEQFTDEERAKLWISVGVGATGTAVAEDRVVVAGDDLVGPVPAVARVHRVLRAHRVPLDDRRADHRRGGPARRHRGLLEGARRVHETDAGLVGALAGQAAIAITNARLIDELAGREPSSPRPPTPSGRCARSPAASARCATRSEILQSVIDASARLLRASGVTIDLLGGQGMAEAWLDPEVRRGPRPNLDLLDERRGRRPTSASRAWRSGPGPRSRGPASTSRTTASSTRPTATPSSASRRSTRCIAAPLVHRDEVFGVINAYSDRADAFDDTDAGLLAALADQAAVAIANARLIEELRAVPRRRSPGAPMRSGRCARSRPASRPSSTRPRSSSGSPTRRPASSSPTAPASTSTTRRSTRCAGRTRRATRCRRCPTGRRPVASSPARPWAGLAFKDQRAVLTTRLPRPTSGSTTRRRSTRSSSGCASAR